jgi:hypothetical protein
VTDERPFEGAEPYSLAGVVEAHRRWLYLPDAGALEALLATVAANRLSGDPLWLLLVGPSSGGKTALLSSIATLEDVHPAATFTEAALLSGTSPKERAKEARGGLLRVIGDFGIIVCKDFGSILSMNRDARAQTLAALREIYDGSWARHVGTAGGQALAWSGKVGFVGGATGAIDRHHGVMAALGERFLMYRVAVDDADEQAQASLRHHGHEAEMRAELADAVSGLSLSAKEPEPITADDRDRLVALAGLVARARSPVLRDDQRREIELVPEPEAPGRLVGALAHLLTGLRVIGAEEDEAWRVVVKTGLDSMPAGRWRALELLLAAGADSKKTAELATKLGLATTPTRRILEDLAAHGVIKRFSVAAGEAEGRADLWQVEATTAERYALATVSEMSGGLDNPPFKTLDYTFDDIPETVSPGSENGQEPGSEKDVSRTRAKAS